MLCEGLIGESAVVWANSKPALWRISVEICGPVQEMQASDLIFQHSRMPTSGCHENEIPPGNCI